MTDKPTEQREAAVADGSLEGTTFVRGITARLGRTAEGWICPRCGRVNAPHIDQCSCEPPVRINPLPVFPQPIYPQPCPYPQPYYPPYSPGWPWNPNTIIYG